MARLARISAANRPPTSVCRDNQLSLAITEMLANDFSQLPVMQNTRDVNGFVSWKTIGRAMSRGVHPQTVSDAMEPATVLEATTPLFDAVQAIARHEFVLVKGASKNITGVVTTSDISTEFRTLAEPFLLISQIEGHLRQIIDGRFTPQELSAVRDSDDAREVKSVLMS